MFGIKSEWQIPSVFEADSRYILRSHCFVGWYPNVADGDIRTVSLPSSFGYSDSGVFTVRAP